MTSEFVPKFQTPWDGQQKPVRTFGLRVHPEEVKRVDAFRSAFPEGSRIRGLIEEALVKGKEKKPEGISDREYFEVLGRMLGEREVLDLNIIRRISSMPAWVQGDAFRVALERKERDRNPYPLEEFNGDLIKDKKENIPGEKEEQVIQAIRRHVQQAQMEGKISRGGPGLIYDFGERLGNSGPELVNLLYYGQDSVERILETSLGMKDFIMSSTAVREWVIDIAEQILFSRPEHRMYALRAFAEDFKKAAHDCKDMDRAGVARMIIEIPLVCSLHGANLL
ncbi:hypothetical protein H0O01_01090 [Candidatus Micrarchaeota archaeon]|nr:hypothetical protein [Candidatus Micrarchaeota archaeon]